MTANVAAHLARLAASDPDRPAVVVPHARGRTSRTFRELNADATHLAAGLVASGIVRGTRVAVMVPPGLDFFSLAFALFRLAAIPVLIDPGMGVRNLGTCLADAAPEAFIGVPKAHLARRLLGWAKRTVRVTVNVGRGRFFCDRSLNDFRAAAGSFTPPEVSASDPAAILFTSGSTGVAKGVEYEHGHFAAQVELLKSTYGIAPGEIDLCTFPLFALFGPALGMTCVVPDMDASRPATIDAAKAVALVHKYAVTNLFASPAVIRRLADTRIPLPTLKRAISAGAPARADVIAAFAELLSSGADVFTPYGATEALPVANVGGREILGETRALTESGRGVCVGRPVAGMSVSVIPISDAAIETWDADLCLPAGEIGEFVVRGSIVTKKYFRRDAATKLAKIYDPATGETLHRMGDVGYLDDRGRLWFCGRKSHRVVAPAGTLFPDMIEPVFNTIPGITRTALVGVVRGGVTHAVLCVERPRDFPALLPRLRAADRHGLAFLPYPRLFPVDVRHNSKIFREKLAAWADRVFEGPA